MAISRYREPASLFGLQRLNRILDEAFSGLPFPEQGNVITSTWFAPTDVSEDQNTLRITMELPGVDPEDVRLSLENNILTIRGEKKQQSEENNERVHRFERTYGMFERTFALPNTVDPEKIEARYSRALGSAELQGQSVERRMLEVEQAAMNSQAQARLAEIRSSLGLSAPAESSPSPEVEPGETPSA